MAKLYLRVNGMEVWYIKFTLHLDRWSWLDSASCFLPMSWYLYSDLVPDFPYWYGTYFYLDPLLMQTCLIVLLNLLKILFCFVGKFCNIRNTQPRKKTSFEKKKVLDVVMPWPGTAHPQPSSGVRTNFLAPELPWASWANEKILKWVGDISAGNTWCSALLFTFINWLQAICTISMEKDTLHHLTEINATLSGYIYWWKAQPNNVAGNHCLPSGG